MKTTVVLISSLAFVLGGVPKDRFDPCIFIDCSKLSTSSQAPITPSPSPPITQKTHKSENTGKFESKLVNVRVLIFLTNFLKDGLDSRMN